MSRAPGETRIPRILSIAGTDPTGGAGIQADLKSIAANGGYGMAVVTALVAQNTAGVRSVHVPPVEFLREQLDAVSDDVTIDAVKIGMLADAPVIAVVRDWLTRVRPPIVVLDPVMVATSGDRLLLADAERSLRELLPLATVVTPNIAELAILADEPVAASWPEVIAQASRLSAQHGVTVLAKGGHLDGADAPDALVDASDGVRVTQIGGERIATRNTHGTGCSLSSALATRLVTAPDAEHALREAKAWLSESIRHGEGLDVGEGRGPISHFAGLWSRGGLVTRPSAAEIEAEWWQGIRQLRDDIDELPFVIGLGDGTLDETAFRWYLEQDALYLREYARVLAAASRLAPTSAEQAFWAASAQGAITGELQLHQSWLGDTAGGGGPSATTPSRTTTAYLDHLAARSADGSYEVLVAALLPCFWLYHDLGVRLHALSHAQHPYSSWLDTYADEAFTESTERAIAIVTAAASRAGEVTREAMRAAFIRSSEHEVAFFAAPLLPH